MGRLVCASAGSYFLGLLCIRAAVSSIGPAEGPFKAQLIYVVARAGFRSEYGGITCNFL